MSIISSWESTEKNHFLIRVDWNAFFLMRVYWKKYFLMRVYRKKVFSHESVLKKVFSHESVLKKSIFTRECTEKAFSHESVLKRHFLIRVYWKSVFVRVNWKKPFPYQYLIIWWHSATKGDQVSTERCPKVIITSFCLYIHFLKYVQFLAWILETHPTSSKVSTY